MASDLKSGDEKNIHQKYYDENEEHLEKRFPYRKKGNKYLYLIQNILVFGSAIIGLIALLRSKISFQRSYRDVCGIEVSIAACVLNLIFAYGFGFVAVVNDWWFFFPDAFSNIMWHIPMMDGSTTNHGYMVLGDVVFYILATIMGHLAVIFVLRLEKPVKHRHLDALGKLLWFLILFTVGIFGITFGSQVMQGMVKWLYIPFGLAAVMFVQRYNAVQLWFPTGVFIVCEFIWDAVARIMGVWIFPDATTNPGLYIPEITLFHLGRFPVIWQPEMTQMAYVSGMICLTFYLVSHRYIRGGDSRN